FFFSLIPLSLRSTLFPYTTLFRSDFVGLQRNRMIELDRWSRPFVRPLVHRFNHCLGPKRYFAGQQLVKDDAHGKNVSTDIGLFRSEEHTSELQSRENLVCRLLLEK